MKYFRIILFSLFFSLLFYSTPGFTYSRDTHEELNKKAVNISVLATADYLNKHLGFSEGIYEKINKKRVWEWIRDGGRTEDEPKKRCKNHFHNPLEEDWNKAGLSDIFSGDSSVLWAQNINQGWSWKNARDYYYLALTSVTKEERDNNFANMFRSLGQVMHLIEDSSVPAHSRNDTHLLYNYEDWVKGANLDSFLTNPLFFDEAILDITPNSLAPIPIARIVDTDKYVGVNPGVGVGNSIGLSEYANINFLSRDTIFTDNYPESHKHYFPHPKFENTNYKTLATEVAEDGEVDKVRYVSGYGVDYLAGVTLSRRVIKKLKEDGADDIDPDFWRKRGFTNKYDKCYENYAKLLLPRAVGYSAGLLNYFFRGKLDAKIVPVEGKGQNKSELKIKNKSDEDMTEGTLTFLYENKDGEYIELKKQSRVSIKAGEEYEDEFRFNKPKERVVKYILVFNGTLGNESPMSREEKGAVVGKIWLPRVLIVWYESDGGIYMYDLSVDTDEDGIPNYLDSDRPDPDPAKVRLPLTPACNFHIANNRVIYKGYRGGIWPYGSWGIYMYDLTVDSDGDGVPNYMEDPPLDPDPAESLVITPDNPNFYHFGIIDVFGNKIFYKCRNIEYSYRRIVYDIYMYDLNTKVEQYITTITLPRYDSNIAVYGDRMVYEHHYPYPDPKCWNDNIFVYNFSTGEERAVNPYYDVKSEFVDQNYPDIYENKVVYVQNPGQEDVMEYGHIDLYDLSTSVLTRLGEYNEEHWFEYPPPFNHPQIDGNIVTWDVGEEYMGYRGYSENPIHIYNLAQGRELPVTSLLWSFWPKTCRGVVVWGSAKQEGYFGRGERTMIYIYDTNHPEKGSIKLTEVEEGYLEGWNIGF